MDRPDIILYVDDDRDDQEIFVEVIREIRPNIKCEIAGDGMQALKLLSEMEPPICIYLDLNMPVMNGLELLQHIKSNPLLKNIPTFILTTARNRAVEEQALEIGAAAYITKPTDFHEFKKMLDTCLLAHTRSSILL